MLLYRRQRGILYSDTVGSVRHCGQLLLDDISTSSKCCSEGRRRQVLGGTVTMHLKSGLH